MKKVLVIAYVWPEPNSSAAGSQMMQLLACFLSQQWQVHFSSPAALSQHSVDLKSLSITVTNIGLNDSSFDDYISALVPDIVVFDRFMMEEQFGWRVEKCCPNALRILHTVDLHCLRVARQVALKEQRDLTQADLNSDTAKREVASILRCDLSLLISKYELDLLRHEFKIDMSLLCLVPFMLDTLSKNNNWPSFEDRQHFISIGNFRHEPNWDAVLYLKNTIWPLIHKKLPTAELHIYGSYPAEKATVLTSRKQNFIVKGWANDAFEVISRARILVAPLRFGAGLKGKLIDAMCCGTPSITSSIGAEAMHGELDKALPWNGLICDEPEYFAKAAMLLYQDQDLWLQKQLNGIKIINRFYHKKTHSDYLLKCINDTLANLEQHRLNNFTGAMLRHHSMKSTKYMSRWIEAKNKV